MVLRKAQGMNNHKENFGGVRRAISEAYAEKDGTDVFSNGNFDCPTGFSTGISEASSSGTSKGQKGRRYRPPKKMRRFKPKVQGSEAVGAKLMESGESAEKLVGKRRAEDVACAFSRVSRRSKTEVVPTGGLPNQ